MKLFFSRSMQTTLVLSICLHRTKQTTYWPGLYDQMHELFTNCQTCLKFSNNNHKQPPSQQQEQEVPLVPWSKLATYIFHFENCSYQIMVYYYSRLPLIMQTRQDDSQTYDKPHARNFSKYGWPDLQYLTIGHDTMPQKPNKQWKTLVCYITNSPQYQQSNIQAEKNM